MLIHFSLLVVFIILVIYSWYSYKSFKSAKKGVIGNVEQLKAKKSTKESYRDYDPNNDPYIEDLDKRLRQYKKAQGKKPKKPGEMVKTFLMGVIQGGIGGLVMGQEMNAIAKQSMLMGSLRGSMSYFM
jgi:hypothetical protein